MMCACLTNAVVVSNFHLDKSNELLMWNKCKGLFLSFGPDRVIYYNCILSFLSDGHQKINTLQ